MQLQTGKWLQVFAIREVEKNGAKVTTWTRAGSARINRDLSINVYLDVLPVDGVLHVREGSEKQEPRPPQPTAAPAGAPTDAAAMMGGH